MLKNGVGSRGGTQTQADGLSSPGEVPADGNRVTAVLSHGQDMTQGLQRTPDLCEITKGCW